MVRQGGCSSTVEPQPSKLMMWVRFPSPAPNWKDVHRPWVTKGVGPHSSGAEHFLGKEEVPGSNPGVGSRLKMQDRRKPDLRKFVNLKLKPRD